MGLQGEIDDEIIARRNTRKNATPSIVQAPMMNPNTPELSLACPVGVPVVTPHWSD